jgi:hypothetical protein
MPGVCHARVAVRNSRGPNNGTQYPDKYTDTCCSGASWSGWFCPSPSCLSEPGRVYHRYRKSHYVRPKQTGFNFNTIGGLKNRISWGPEIPHEVYRQQESASQSKSKFRFILTVPTFRIRIFTRLDWRTILAGTGSCSIPFEILSL